MTDETLIPEEGYCYVHMRDSKVVPKYILGSFFYKGYKYLLHEDADNPDLICVSEASTGYSLAPKVNPNPDYERAYENAIRFLRSNYTMIPTLVSGHLVRTQLDLSSANNSIISLCVQITFL